MVEAVNGKASETLVVRGDDFCAVVVELAQQCGIGWRMRGYTDSMTQPIR